MITTLDSRQLLAFATLARRESFTQTARDMFLTQSAVSHAIKALETEVGARLFDRSGRTVRLTPEGERLLRRAERILREMQDARAEMAEIRKWGHGRLRVGASPTACQYLLPTVLREFRQSFHHCAIRIEPGDGPEMLELLHGGQIDLALTLEPGGRGETEFRPLFEDELRILVAPMHPWARQGRAPAGEIATESFILYNKGSYTFRMVMDYFQRDGITLGNFIELGSMEAIKELVKTGVGAGILAPWIARKELAEKSLVSLPPGARELRRSWGVACLKGRKLTLAEETFVGLCEAVTENLLNHG